MSAILLLWIFVAGSSLIAACNNRYVSSFIAPLQTTILPTEPDEMSLHSRNNTIIVEEVDKNGNSVVKELELPDYDGSRELRDDKKRTEQQNQIQAEDVERDVYGCNIRDETQRRKCLLRRKRVLRRKYKSWKDLIRRVIQDLDRKIKNLGSDCMKELKADKVNASSELLHRKNKKRK